MTEVVFMSPFAFVILLTLAFVLLAIVISLFKAWVVCVLVDHIFIRIKEEVKKHVKEV